jgi:serine protease Do
MRGIDLARYRFDYDLTFAMVLMHPDGHVYHRYGGRDVRSADVWLSQASFATLLETTLEEHDVYDESPSPPDAADALRLEEVPAFAAKDQGKCIHCHSVLESLYRQRKADDELRDEDLWVFPSPARIGIDLDRDDQRSVTRVDEGSPAARAGLRVGDRIMRIGATPIATASDVMHALDQVPALGGEVAVQLRRGKTNPTLSLQLEAGWRTGTPLSFSWRPLKWALDPVPGFGGAVLSDADRKTAGLADEPFAFRIDYFVTWGPRQDAGRAARAAGLRDGDVVYRVADQRIFESIDHFHTWWRLTRTPGEQVVLRYSRDGERGEATLTVGAR